MVLRRVAPSNLNRHRCGAIGLVLFALSLSATPTRSAHAGGILTVGMTAGDIPVTTGNPDQGFEGYRFVGYNLYDALLLWDLSKSDTPSEPKPGLATSYEIDPNDQKRWVVHLRQRCDLARRLQIFRRRCRLEFPDAHGSKRAKLFAPAIHLH